MSYELARAYAEYFDQDPGWITRPPLPESVASDLLQAALARGEPVTPDEMDAAWTQRLGIGYPPALLAEFGIVPVEAPEVRVRRLP